MRLMAQDYASAVKDWEPGALRFSRTVQAKIIPTPRRAAALG